MENKLYLYPGLIRIWHLLNALLIITLIISGLSMQYSDPLKPFNYPKVSAYKLVPVLALVFTLNTATTLKVLWIMPTSHFIKLKIMAVAALLIFLKYND